SLPHPPISLRMTFSEARSWSFATFGRIGAANVHQDHPEEAPTPPGARFGRLRCQGAAPARHADSVVSRDRRRAHPEDLRGPDPVSPPAFFDRPRRVGPRLARSEGSGCRAESGRPHLRRWTSKPVHTGLPPPAPPGCAGDVLRLPRAHRRGAVALEPRGARTA